MQDLKEVLCKVTGISPGLLEQTSSKQIGGLTYTIFACDAESDEYAVLSNKAGVVEIKNGYTTYGAEAIKNLLNPPPTLDSSSTSQGFGGLSSIIGTLPIVPTPAQFTNMPPALSVTLNIPALQQYIVDFIKLNPGCVYSLFDPANPSVVNEASTHIPSAWTFAMLDDNSVTFDASGCSDSAIASQVIAYLEIDPSTLAITNISIE